MEGPCFKEEVSPLCCLEGTGKARLVPYFKGTAYSLRPELKCRRVMGPKLRYRRPCTHDLSAGKSCACRHPLLPCTTPHCFHFFRTPLTISCWHNPGSWIEQLLIWLDLPCGLHLSARASDFWTCPQTPPVTKFAQKRCQSTGLELRIYLELRGSGLERNWISPQNK